MALAFFYHAHQNYIGLGNKCFQHLRWPLRECKELQCRAYGLPHDGSVVRRSGRENENTALRPALRERLNGSKRNPLDVKRTISPVLLDSELRQPAPGSHFLAPSLIFGGQVYPWH